MGSLPTSGHPQNTDVRLADGTERRVQNVGHSPEFCLRKTARFSDIDLADNQVCSDQHRLKSNLDEVLTYVYFARTVHLVVLSLYGLELQC